MAPKARSKSAGKAKAKSAGKTTAKSKPMAEPCLASNTARGPITHEEREWCEKFQGVPLEFCSLDEIPIPPTLNSAQVRIWKLLWERGQNHLKGERTELGGPDDAMRKVLLKTNEADPDTQVAAEHVRTWLCWFDESFADAFNFMDSGDNDDDTT